MTINFLLLKEWIRYFSFYLLDIIICPKIIFQTSLSEF